MIPKTASFFWAGGSLSFLRFLSIASFRRVHPDWKINLFLGLSHCMNTKWKYIKQDFQIKRKEDWTEQAKKLCDVCEEYRAPTMCAPNFQSDFFRWEILKIGGWYLDIDQLVIRSFDSLCSQDFIYAAYNLKNKKIYTPVGVLGASANNEVVKLLNKLTTEFFNPHAYCSIGPRLFEMIYKNNKISSTAFNSGRMFYPANFDEVSKLYDGSFKINEAAKAIHWFAGHPLSQKFNAKYDLQFAIRSNDTLSRRARRLFGEKLEWVTARV